MLTRFIPVLNKIKMLRAHAQLLWHAFKNPLTPAWIKGFMIGVVAYLLSPIDLIPDVLLILGLTDDLVVVSAAMWFLSKVIPERVRQTLPPETRAKLEGTTFPAKESGKTGAKTPTKPPTDPAKAKRLKIFGLGLLALVLIAAVASHPAVQEQLSAISPLFSPSE